MSPHPWLLGKPSAVYRLYDSADVLLYVGISHQPEVRFKHHAAGKPWWPDVARKSVIWFSRREDAEAAETIAVAVEVPRHNTRKVGMFHGVAVRVPQSWVKTERAIGAARLPKRVAHHLLSPPGTLVLRHRMVLARDDEPVLLANSWYGVYGSDPACAQRAARWLVKRRALPEECAALRLQPGAEVEVEMQCLCWIWAGSGMDAAEIVWSPRALTDEAGCGWDLGPGVRGRRCVHERMTGGSAEEIPGDRG